MTPRPLPASDPAATAEGVARWALTSLLAGASLALGLVACGGGGSASESQASAASPGVTATGFTQGAISGFGSIIVNGVRFDETNAAVTDDSDTARAASGLKLGMQVEVDHATVNASAGTAAAVAVRYGSLATGPVSAVSTSANTLTVLGQVVDISSSTVFADTLSAGLGAVTVGSVIDVHGQVDATTGHITASRIEPITTTTTSYKLRGAVAGLDTSAKTFSIGGAVINYAGLATSAVPSTLANGVSLRVQLATAQSAGQWVAQSLKPKVAHVVADHSTGHLRGKITAFTSSASFTLGSVVVDASAAAFPDGRSTLALGVEVEVKGTVTNNVLVANTVGIEAKHDAEPGHGLALIGAITAFDATAKTFVVRNVTVGYGDATTYVNGVVGDLAVGKNVSVAGSLGKQRHDSVQASQITFNTAAGK